MPLDEQLYPVNLRVSGHRCLVVGGGAVAAQKVRGLLECGADVIVVAPEVCEDLASLGEAVTIHRRSYRSNDLAAMRLIVAATGDPEVQSRIAADARAAGVLVNSADDPDNCDFTLPSRVRQGHVLVTASTSGHSPALSVWLRRQLESEIGPEYEVLLEVLADARSTLRQQGVATEGLAWQDALDSGILDLVREGRIREAKERLQACLSLPSE
jgi:precorrin-2 dehydrogenase